MTGTRRRGLRADVATAAALAVLVAAAVHPGAVPTRAQDPRPNIVVILTDDQSLETLPHMQPPAMPWLQSQINDPAGHWQWFPNAVFNTPLCCPSRATILTGQYSHHTGVVNNDTGYRLNDGQTLPVWLHGAGYTTGLIGKYLNLYPFGRLPYVPPGWDRWFAKLNESGATTYYDYSVIDQTTPLHFGSAPDQYATTELASQAVRFIQAAPAARPFFLYLTPPAPHRPWVAAPGDRGAFADLPLKAPAADTAPVTGKPAWVQALPALDPAAVAARQNDRRAQYASLLEVDRSVHAIVDALAQRGQLQNTYIFFLTDNGFSFGEHRIVGKRCPYDECIRTPFAVFSPTQPTGTDPLLVSNVDLAPTIAQLAGVTPGASIDGSSFASALTGPPGSVGTPTSQAKLIEWAGDAEISPWWGVRTPDFAYIESADGTVELYDLSGRRGHADPGELHNVADAPRYAAVVARLAAELRTLRGPAA